jgi:hypothetical protein
MKKQLLGLLWIATFLAMPLVSATDFNQTLTQEDRATFDHILEPVLKIYNLVKYAATFIAVIVLLLAGANYIMSGSDPKKRDNAKSMVTYVLIGLVVIWAAPLVVQFITG